MLTRHTALPLGRDSSGRFLPWLVAFMVYLATLATTGAIGMQKIVARWDQGLAGRITVQVPPPEEGPAGDTAYQAAKKILPILEATPGVRRAKLLEEEDIARLLEPWLGEGVLEQNLPVPALITVTVDSDAPPDLAALTVRLSRVVPGVIVDDHQRWLGNLLDLARTIESIAAIVVVAVGLSAVISVVFVTRTGLAIHLQVINLLHLIGAQDSYIARQFETHALLMGLRGGVIGLVLAVLTVLLFGYLIGRSESGLLPDLSLSFVEWLILAALPVATALVAMLTARLTVLHDLSRLH